MANEKHFTEERCPEQVREFRKMIEEMYKVHLDKNADYSTANILGTGEIGVVVRLWDKMCRLMSLYGFRVKVSGVEFTPPREPKNESIDDTLLDAANYSIIMRILRKGKWGK